MEKNTFLAVVLSVIIITVGFMVQNHFWPREQRAPSAPQSTGTQPAVTAPVTGPSDSVVTQIPDSGIKAPVLGTVMPVPETVLDEIVRFENDVFKAEFSTKGAILKSLKLLRHKDKKDFVELILSGDSGKGAFEFTFGGPDARPVTTEFHVRRPDVNTIVFYKDFFIVGYEDSPFRLTKSFFMNPGEYLMQVEILLENSQNQYLPLNFNNTAYTLGFGPQIGPSFEKLDGRYDYRHFYYYDGKRRLVEIKQNKETKEPMDTLLDKQASWFGIGGKYFAVLAAPVFSDFQVNFSKRPVEGQAETSKFFISRPVIRSSRNTDMYRFYMGPMVAKNLSIFNHADQNAFGLKDMRFDEVVDSSFFLGWLEFLLKALLQVFYSMIPNWGVAIILVTIVVKIVTFPLTQKSYKSTSRMQALGPKLAELKEKYKGNQAKMNQEMAAIYKREGVNPVSGCLPMLLQLPIFLAMYGLFNNHFDLRGASFILWITDLSTPDSIWNFAPVTIPFLGWSDLRLLPFIFVGTQLVSSKMMQTPGAISNAQMKMMTFGLPVVFFFILYDVPSGLLVYWIVQNVLSVAQQHVINRKRKLAKE